MKQENETTTTWSIVDSTRFSNCDTVVYVDFIYSPPAIRIGEVRQKKDMYVDNSINYTLPLFLAILLIVAWWRLR